MKYPQRRRSAGGRTEGKCRLIRSNNQAQEYVTVLRDARTQPAPLGSAQVDRTALAASAELLLTGFVLLGVGGGAAWRPLQEPEGTAAWMLSVSHAEEPELMESERSLSVSVGNHWLCFTWVRGVSAPDNRKKERSEVRED
ncbi:unnamed protein product [Pleuronectes platessa]|uniref:Uncharacterized protein n=1 Tax=Pleuronectes platessa TaxID=8262 RepID=A0A9N7Y0M6_PLEPL|nr:unnamed protein product [Pleuronectes platessa]